MKKEKKHTEKYNGEGINPASEDEDLLIKLLDPNDKTKETIKFVKGTKSSQFNPVLNTEKVTIKGGGGKI